MQQHFLGLTIEDFSVIREIKKATNERHLWSCFMNDQFQNHAKKNGNGFRWNQEVIKNCIILHARGPGSYEYIRKSGMVLIPHTFLLTQCVITLRRNLLTIIMSSQCMYISYIY